MNDGGAAVQGGTRAKTFAEPELDPPFDIIEPGVLATGLVLSSPHSGNVYPSRFLASARLDAASLRRSEDAFVDELFLEAVGLGAPMLRARFPRAYLDVNREPYELDPRMFEGRLPAFANTRSMRVAGGLGTIARVVGDAQEIYAKRLPVEEALQRIEGLHKPYHAALHALMDRAVRRFGHALLVDCHSMPSCSSAVSGAAPREDRAKADFVIGDRYGTSCDRIFVDAAEYELRRFGYAVERNKPYAGGFITEHYGQPTLQRHALQIEINRALYMDERSLQRRPEFQALAGHITVVIRALAALLDAGSLGERAAAE
jgi:N-formylglutamate amidohydrolase